MGNACSELCINKEKSGDDIFIHEREQIKQACASLETQFKELEVEHRKNVAGKVKMDDGAEYKEVGDAKTKYCGYMLGFGGSQKNGFGTMLYNPSGDTSYTGQWEKNKIRGLGRFKDKNGSYTGFWEQGKKHGLGMEAWYEDDSTFLGYYVLGKKEGEGMYIFGDGTTYEGQFKDGEISGEGKLTDENGVYTGQFLDSVQHGTGRWEYDNGDVYDGQFLEGERHGEGTMSWGGQNKAYSGQWNDGVPHGQGRIRIDDKLRDACYIDGKPCTDTAWVEYHNTHISEKHVHADHGVKHAALH